MVGSRINAASGAVFPEISRLTRACSDKKLGIAVFSSLLYVRVVIVLGEYQRHAACTVEFPPQSQSLSPAGVAPSLPGRAGRTHPVSVAVMCCAQQFQQVATYVFGGMHSSHIADRLPALLSQSLMIVL